MASLGKKIEEMYTNDKKYGVIPKGRFINKPSEPTTSSGKKKEAWCKKCGGFDYEGIKHKCPELQIFNGERRIK